jgi:hypothetical protein
MYRSSRLALYSNYQLPAPPIRALTNDWDDERQATTNRRAGKHPGRITARRRYLELVR